MQRKSAEENQKMLHINEITRSPAAGQCARQPAAPSRVQIAERMGTTVSVVAWIENSLRNQKPSPSRSPTFDTLLRYAEACGKRLRIVLE